jgi:hypothetical protein
VAIDGTKIEANVGAQAREPRTNAHVLDRDGLVGGEAPARDQAQHSVRLELRQGLRRHPGAFVASDELGHELRRHEAVLEAVEDAGRVELEHLAEPADRRGDVAAPDRGEVRVPSNLCDQVVHGDRPDGHRRNEISCGTDC